MKFIFDDIKQDLANTVAHWEHMDGDDFNVAFRFAGGDAYFEITTQDEIFGYIDEGTTERHAKMSADFVPKSYHRVLKSSPGQGGVEDSGPHVNMPGIKPREFMAEIQDKYEPLLFDALEFAIIAGVS